MKSGLVPFIMVAAIGALGSVAMGISFSVGPADRDTFFLIGPILALILGVDTVAKLRWAALSLLIIIAIKTIILDTYLQFSLTEIIRLGIPLLLYHLFWRRLCKTFRFGKFILLALVLMLVDYGIALIIREWWGFGFFFGVHILPTFIMGIGLGIGIEFADSWCREIRRLSTPAEFNTGERTAL